MTERAQEKQGRKGRGVKGRESALGSPVGNGISRQFIRDCMFAKDLGDGLLYANILKDRFIYNATAKDWFRWAGHNWVEDKLDEYLAATEYVVDRLLEEASLISEQIHFLLKDKGDSSRQKELTSFRDVIYAAIKRYRTTKGRNAMTEFARSCRDYSMAIVGSEFDADPWLLGCSNGVLDLRTGKFRNGRPEDWISKACPTEWQGFDVKAERFEAWLLEVMDGDRDLYTYLHRLFGYAITGLDHEHIFVVLHGPKGRNGKGTLVKILSHVLGPLAGPIPSEMLLDQGRVRSSAGPSPDIIALRGLRLAFASEIDEDKKISAGRVKWLTGGDILTGRNLNERITTFPSTHTLFLLTNSIPDAPATDQAFWERTRVIPFRLSFVDRTPSAPNERPVDKNILESLKQEASGILAWLVKGCMAYQREGLQMPLVVSEETAKWRQAEDDLLDFIENYCTLDLYAKTQATDLYENFNRWFKVNISKKGISQTRFGKIMSKRFQKVKQRGIYYYEGVDLIKKVPDEDQDGNQDLF